ncbi:MAG TPA: carboxypeptidase-like regulatory domain-containing protein [Vicinamibacterales bacterium]|nr:carboxypeptidase-like regulatory domain-containing protein [Vicinamibacterales bacterium]
MALSRTSVVAALGAVALASPLLLAQAQAPATPQPPGQTQAPPKSTAFILGQVVDGTSGQPIPEAIVTLRRSGGGARGAAPARGGDAGNIGAAIAMEQAMAGRGGPQEQRLMTGGDGKFVFHSLPPGNFTLTVTLNGYSSTLAGSAANFNPLVAMAGLNLPSSGANSPTTITLTEGQRVSDAKLRLWKNAAIMGTVQDDGGEPAIGLTVQAMSRIVLAGRARYVPAGSGRTDDRGAYRIASMQPGDYIVVIPQAPAAVPAAMMDTMMKGLGGGDMSGMMGMLDLASSGVNIGAAMQGGVRLGNYMVASVSGAPPILAADGKLFVYQTAFYPGVAVPVQAEVITLKSGDERGDVNFQLRLTPTARVSGVATGPTGPMGSLGMRLVVPADGVTSDSEFDVASVVTAADGSFTFFGVPPGQFLLRAQKEARANDMAGMMTMMGMGRGAAPPAGPAKSVFGQAMVSVGATDLEGLTFQLAEGVTVAGRVEFASGTGRAQPQSTNMQVTLIPADGRNPGGFGNTRPRVTTTLTFETPNYGPGKYFLQIQGTPPQWQVKSATVGGRDVLDAPIDLRDADITGVLITLSDEQFALSGTVTVAAGHKADEAIVYLFPADHRAWIENGMNPRRSRSTRVAASGAYTFTVLPAGDYLAVAVDRSDEGNLQDPAFIEALSRLGTRVSVVSAKQSQDLTTMKVKR